MPEKRLIHHGGQPIVEPPESGQTRQPSGFLSEQFAREEKSRDPKTEKIPAIRFRGFTDAWEQRELGENCEITTGGTPTTSNSDYWNPKEIPWLSSGEVHKKRISATDDKISRLGLENSSARWVKPCSVLVALAGQGKTRGTVAINEIALTTNQSIAAIYPEEHDAEFLFQNLESRYEELRAISSADGSRGGLNKHLLSAVTIPYAETREQQKIGIFFRDLDSLITLHQRVYFQERTDQTINGHTKTDSWEQREFSEITYPAGEKNRDNHPYESFSITNEDGFVPQNEKFENGGTMRDADKRMYFIVSPNSFAYNPARINVGSIGYQNLHKNVIVSSLYEVFKTTSDVDDRFLWHWFKSENFQRLIEHLQEGGVRLYFYYDKLCQGHLPLPTIEEQQEIGRYFDHLDHLITLHQREYLLFEVLLC